MLHVDDIIFRSGRARCGGVRAVKQETTLANNSVQVSDHSRVSICVCSNKTRTMKVTHDLFLHLNQPHLKDPLHVGIMGCIHARCLPHHTVHTRHHTVSDLLHIVLLITTSRFMSLILCPHRAINPS